MTRILILSKNSLAEQDLQCSLQRMNEEVYCSSSLLSYADTCLDIVNYFSLVILSNTISTFELEGYLPCLLKADAKILRKGDSEQVKNGEHAWMLDKIDGWITEDMTFAEIMEIIARFRIENDEHQQHGNQLQLNQHNSYNLPNTDFKQFVSYLSRKERNVLLHIYNAEGYLASREELCLAVWNSSPTNSSLSQLSTIIHRIKKKLKEKGIDTDEIQTVWGEGYRMGNRLHTYLSQNDIFNKVKIT
ncbi:helix-turn-helix domain-containing protein [Enterococcus avium]|uniref:helix-turn-helix domain-containing protein n=1 Tax=Enterococcus avium TaxID=33945 RepID=UPI0034D33C4A